MVKKIPLIAAIFLLGAVTGQQVVGGVYFGAVGAADNDLAIVRSEVSGSPVLNVTFGTSDAQGYEIGATTICAEGATDDASETCLGFADATADVTYQFRTDSADTYYPLAMPDGDITNGFWTMPGWASADANLATNVSDNEMIVYRVYIPHYLTVANIYGRADVITDSSTDDTLAVAIYEDADAGAQLTEAQSADQTADSNITFDVTDVTLGPGFYRIGVCSQDISGVAFVAETLDDEFIDVANLGAVTIGTAANACTAGNPPATTGALSTDDVNMAVLKLGG